MDMRSTAINPPKAQALEEFWPEEREVRTSPFQKTLDENGPFLVVPFRSILCFLAGGRKNGQRPAPKLFRFVAVYG